MPVEDRTRVLITALPPSRLPGAVPTAPVGRSLAHQLVRDRVHVRVLVPAEEASGWPADAEIVEGSVTDPCAAEAAFVGVDRAFVAGLVSFEFARMRELTNLLLSGPVSRVVVLSSHGSDFETSYSPETWQWLAFERAMELADATCVHLRPGGLFANAIDGGYPVSGADWKRALAEGRPVREFLPDAAYPFIDEADVAEIAARLLLDDVAAGGEPAAKLDVVGSLSSAAERVAIVNEVLGTDLRLEAIADQDDARRFWRGQGWPEVTIDVTLYAMQAFHRLSDETRGAIDAQITTAEALLGRRPRTFHDWVTAHASFL